MTFGTRPAHEDINDGDVAIQLEEQRNGAIEMDGRWIWASLMVIEERELTWCCLDRFSQLIFSTQPQPLKLASTSSKYEFPIIFASACLATSSEVDFYPSQNLVPAPRSFFMDVKCPGCFTITTVFSHAQTVVICAGCSTVLCQPTGGKARLTEGCSFRRK